VSTKVQEKADHTAQNGQDLHS